MVRKGSGTARNFVQAASERLTKVALHTVVRSMMAGPTFCKNILRIVERAAKTLKGRMNNSTRKRELLLDFRCFLKWPEAMLKCDTVDLRSSNQNKCLSAG